MYTPQGATMLQLQEYDTQSFSPRAEGPLSTSVTKIAISYTNFNSVKSWLVYWKLNCGHKENDEWAAIPKSTYITEESLHV